MIATPQGERAIETLAVGDKVMTRDHGMQPIRWIGQRAVKGHDRFAPILITPGVVTGLHQPLLVSPQHRMLFMLFDTHEVIYANGAATESFHPGQEGIAGVDDAAREELFAIFPELRADIGQYGQTARMCLRGHEAQMVRMG